MLLSQSGRIQGGRPEGTEAFDVLWEIPRLFGNVCARVVGDFDVSGAVGLADDLDCVRGRSRERLDELDVELA